MVTDIVARIVHYLRQHLVGKTLAVVRAQEDSSVFGKVGTSAAEVQSCLAGKKVLSAGQQGKYFWYTALWPLDDFAPSRNRTVLMNS
jgi:formamidopyrimidine-DNA glycosylase